MADVTWSKIDPRPPTGFFCSLDGRVLNIGNGDLGNANISYFYFDLLKAGFNLFTLQFVLTATTLTIEGTNDHPDVDNASAIWVDIMDMLTENGAVSFTTTGSLTMSKPIAWPRLRVKRVTTNATNAVKLFLSRMKQS